MHTKHAGVNTGIVIHTFDRNRIKCDCTVCKESTSENGKLFCKKRCKYVSQIKTCRYYRTQGRKKWAK